MQFNRDGGFLTYRKDGVQHCLGYLAHFPEHGVFDAELGQIEGVTPAEADAHNKLFDEALIKGLDETCDIGQGGSFYMRSGDNMVRTFLSTEIGEAKRVGRVIVLERNGRTFHGKRASDCEIVFFTRVA